MYAIRASLFALGFALVLSVGCTRKNPAVCCNTPDECAQIGLDEQGGCTLEQVCVGGACVQAECEDSMQCPAEEPYCVDRVCSGACVKDADCNGVAGAPYCALDDGVCGACLDDSVCDETVPVCDDATHTCRQCEQDSECASGICLGAEGICALEEDAIFVSMSGADNAACAFQSPCRSITHALSLVTMNRRIIRVQGLDFLAVGGITLDRSVYLDMDQTRIQRDAPGPVITVVGAVDVVLEGLRLADVEDVSFGTSVELGTASTTTLFAVEIARGPFYAVRVTSGTARLLRSRIVSADVHCDQGNVELLDSSMDTAAVTSSNCTSTVARNLFSSSVNHAVLGTSLGLTRFENNLIVHDSPLSDAVSVMNASPGSAVRFNTFVHTTPGAPDSPVAIRCTASISPTSNIIAWNSTLPVQGCTARYSLFDPVAGSVSGEANQAQPYSQIFQNPAASDFRPAPGSLARGSGEPDLGVPDDITGAPRPQPDGENPDVGAYEVP